MKDIYRKVRHIGQFSPVPFKHITLGIGFMHLFIRKTSPYYLGHLSLPLLHGLPDFQGVQVLHFLLDFQVNLVPPFHPYYLQLLLGHLFLPCYQVLLSRRRLLSDPKNECFVFNLILKRFGTLYDSVAVNVKALSTYRKNQQANSLAVFLSSHNT